MSALPNVVLVHGAWADGSCWSSVIESMQAKGYDVTAPQFPETSTENDVARLRQALARVEGPAILAGHSYGGQIMTALGPHPNVAGLVYVAAFGLEEGESIGQLLGGGPPTPALANIAVQAKVLYAVQQPLSMSTFDYTMGEPAWKSSPSWFVVAANDEVIPPDAERQFAARMGATTVEVAAGHLAMVTHPDTVVDLVEQAAAAVTDE
jgi:pimeloyl-ACP methyl ester carboxylesterase